MRTAEESAVASPLFYRLPPRNGADAAETRRATEATRRIRQYVEDADRAQRSIRGRVFLWTKSGEIKERINRNTVVCLVEQVLSNGQPIDRLIPEKPRMAALVE
jgi:hypothetical protein